MRPLWEFNFGLDKYGNFPIFKFHMGFGFMYCENTEGYIWEHLKFGGVYCILARFKKMIFFNWFFFSFSLSPDHLLPHETPPNCSSFLQKQTPLNCISPNVQTLIDRYKKQNFIKQPTLRRVPIVEIRQSRRREAVGRNPVKGLRVPIVTLCYLRHC